MLLFKKLTLLPGHMFPIYLKPHIISSTYSFDKTLFYPNETYLYQAYPYPCPGLQATNRDGSRSFGNGTGTSREKYTSFGRKTCFTREECTSSGNDASLTREECTFLGKGFHLLVTVLNLLKRGGSKIYFITEGRFLIFRLPLRGGVDQKIEEIVIAINIKTVFYHYIFLNHKFNTLCQN